MTQRLYEEFLQRKGLLCRVDKHDRGRKRQRGTGWNTAERTREDKSFQLSAQPCVQVCARGRVCALGYTSLQAFTVANSNFLKKESKKK